MGIPYSERCVHLTLEPLIDELEACASGRDGRTIVFLAAPPGAGKSTLALALQELSEERGGPRLQALPMDGFHHFQSYLESHSISRDGAEIPLASIKGAPESFDLEGLASAIRSLRALGPHPWPAYDRTVHDRVDAAIELNAPIALVEGNWLLLDEPGWRELSSRADLTIFISAREDQLRERLIARKAQGIGRREAEHWFAQVDAVNVTRVNERRLPADIELILQDDGDLVRR